MWEYYSHGRGGPVLDDPEEEITEEGSKFGVEFEATRVGHEPSNHALEAVDGKFTEDVAQKVRSCQNVVVDEATKSEANNHIVRDQPQGVVEADIVAVVGRN